MFFPCRLCFQTYLLNLKKWISTTHPRSPTIPHSASHPCQRKTPQTVCDGFSFFLEKTEEKPHGRCRVQGTERLLLCSVLSPVEPAQAGGACAGGQLLPALHCPGIGNAGFGKWTVWGKGSLLAAWPWVGLTWTLQNNSGSVAKSFWAGVGSKCPVTHSEFSSSTCSPGLFIIFFPIFTQVGGLKIGDPNRITGFLWVVLENLKLNWSVFCFLTWDC